MKTTFKVRQRLEDRYEDGKIIGKGGFGTVFEGRRKCDGKPVAIKEVTKDSKCSLLGGGYEYWTAYQISHFRL